MPHSSAQALNILPNCREVQVFQWGLPSDSKKKKANDFALSSAFLIFDLETHSQKSIQSSEGLGDKATRLTIPQRGIEPAIGKQLLVASHLDNTPLIHHDQAIHRRDR